MKNLTIVTVLLSVLFMAITLQAQEADFVPGQILIKLKESAKAQKTSLRNQIKATTLKSYPNLEIELWEVAQNSLNGKQATLALVEQLNNNPDVEFAEPNYLWKAIGGTQPNDPYFPQLWGLHNAGQNGGTDDADIDAPEAYCMPISAIDVVVGIVDTGIDYTHEDLAENMWQNLGEDANGNGKVLIKSGNTWIFDPGDENGIDDDGNGYIDDFVGWDFVYNDNDPMDLESHGTHCAGTIGAVKDNEIGISGVAPNVKLAALKFLNDGGTGSTDDAVDALNYAVAMGIPITNNSWGGGPFSVALYQAIQNAEANNHLFIAAAGNNKIDNDLYPHYPSSYDNSNVFAVAGTNRNDNLYNTGFYGTNYGATSVDIGAPGQEIYSCVPGNSYANKSGTSMAAPHIAGVCAFVLGANPGSNYNTIKNALMNSVEPITALSEKCVSGGRVNLHNALEEMGAPENPCEEEPPIINPIPEPPFETCDRNRDSLALVAFYNATNGDNWTISWDLNQSMNTWHRVFINKHGCVSGLSITGNNLVGSIPADLGNLSQLTLLQLQGNELTGSIPPELGNLQFLNLLQLADNQLTGNIPAEFGNFTYLETLWLQTNLLTGSIPPQIGNLINLTGLLLSGNQLTGNIPAELGNLTNLKTLTISVNQLTGNIPPEFGNLTTLQNLQLQGNQLTGILPSEMGNMTMLTVLGVHANNLGGCYHLNLLHLCNQLINGTGISGPSNFDATWEDFCATEAGSCGPLVSQVWPGDFNNNGIAEINDLLYWGAAFNNTGASRPSASINWVGQDCENWSTEVNGINSKHQDGNGDGVVNNADITALSNNLGQTHSFTASNGLSSTMQFNLTPDFAANNTNSNNTFVYDFYVEDEGNTVSAHGVSASVFFGALNVVNASIDVSGSSLNPQEHRSHFDSASNTLHFALTKNNGNNSTLNGSVCKIVVSVLVVETGESFALNINSGGIMQANGTLHKVAGTTVYDVYYENGISSNILALNASASHANCENGGSALVNAFGGNGNYCYDWNTGETTQQISDLSPGMYSVLVCDDNGVSNSFEVEVQGQFIPVYDAQGNPLPCNTYTCPTVVDFEAYVPDGTHQAKSAIHTKADLESGYKVELKAGNLIRLTSGFSTRGSQSFKVRMEDCE